MIIPINYKLRIEPDLENFTFKGKVNIKIELVERMNEIILNGKDLEILNIIIKDRKHFFDCEYTFNKEREEYTITYPEGMIKTVFLIIEFTGILNENLLGFYRSSYQINGKTKYNAITQFEEREARAAFPCFDHPAKKATFDIEFVIDEDLQGISCTPIKEEEKQENGKKLIKFEKTPKMSTYLLFFGVGDFKFKVDNSKDPIVRVAAMPNKIEYGDFALDFGRKSLSWMEDYTGIPYPIKKCDYIAVSDFAFGAMENYGAQVYRENALLVYPGKTSKPLITRIGSVIAHETAHMWFGDLVSPLEWKYVWLNESFASYFTVALPDAYHPEWNLWDTFIFESINRAFERDSLLETVPIELPDEEGEPSIDASTAPIIYQKGAAVIQILEGYLGEEKFKKGINYFLNKFQFSNAGSDDYWTAFEEATGEPIKEFADSWVHQGGYPIIDVKRNGNKLELSQKRFTYATNQSDKVWFIPLDVNLFMEDGSTENKSYKFKNKSMEITISENVTGYKFNVGQKGFYRVKYEESNLEFLGKLISIKKLSTTDSYGIINDYYALLRRGDFSISNYLNYIKSYFRGEDEFLTVMDINRHLFEIYRAVKAKREEISSIGVVLFEKILNKIGLNPTKEESVQTANMRESLILRLYLYGSEIVKKFAEGKFEELLEGKTVHPDILGSIMNIGAIYHKKAMDYFMENLLSEETPEMIKMYILRSLGSFTEKAKLEQILQMNLEKIPRKNRVMLFGALGQNPSSYDWLWGWIKENFEKMLEKIHIAHLGGALVMLIPFCGIEHKDEVYEFFNKFIKLKPKMAPTIKMMFEGLEIYSNMNQI